MLSDTPLTLGGLIELLDSHTIGEFYSILKYDYSMEKAYEIESTNTLARENFLGRISWLREPSSELVRRLFNQVNTFFAEKWALAHPEEEPINFAKTCSHLILFRHGKRGGFRIGPIEFGARRDLDLFDARRHFQLLRGIAARLIPQAMDEWSISIGNATRNLEIVLILTMALIAIHPFSDGNGRIARIAHMWIAKRFGLGQHWLAEADDGEFLRVGVGVQSTEYLMGNVVLWLCNMRNHVSVDGRSPSSFDEDKALESLVANLKLCGQSDSLIAQCESLHRLRTHLTETGHFRETSPRFESLRNIVRG